MSHFIGKHTTFEDHVKIYYNLKMDLEKHEILFDRISPVYNWFFNKQVKGYAQILEQYASELDMSPGDKVLDIGCGTGAFARTFSKGSCKVLGIDISKKMQKYALLNDVNCILGNVAEGLDLKDRSFDLVVSAYVAHGLDKEKRMKLFKESARLSRGKVLYHDYSQNRHVLINIIEYLEKGDYFNFIKTGQAEMEEIFSKVKVIPVKKYNNWYICTP